MTRSSGESTAIGALREIFSDVLAVPPESLDRASSPASIQKWDSLHHLSLILGVEERFGVQFEPEEMDRLTTFGQFETCLEEKLKAQS